MFSEGQRVRGADIIWLQRLRPLQRVSSTKIQQHKQLIKVRRGRQQSCPPCWDIQCLPGHCYHTTKGAGWDAQTKEWEQTEIRDGYEEDSGTACVPHRGPQLAGVFVWISRSYVLSRHQLKRMNVSKHPSSPESFFCLENYCRGNYRKENQWEGTTAARRRTPWFNRLGGKNGFGNGKQLLNVACWCLLIYYY